VLSAEFLGNSAAAKKIPRISEAGQLHWTQSGRSALRLAFELEGLGEGDAVLLPDYYCPTMVSPVVAQGATPVFYPLSDGLPDLSWLTNWLANSGGGKPRKSVLLAVHLFGIPIDFMPLQTLAQQHGISLIEDCAHAFLGSRNDVAVGASGDYAIASLPKFFATTAGGVLRINRTAKTTNVSSIGFTEELRGAWDLIQASVHAGHWSMLRPAFAVLYALRGGTSNAQQTTRSTDLETLTEEAVREHAMHDPQLTLTRAKDIDRFIVRHSRYDRIAAARRRNYELIVGALQDRADLVPLRPALPQGAVPYVVPFLSTQANDDYAALRRIGFPVYRWDRFWPGAAPNRDDWGRRVLQISCHQNLNARDIEDAAGALRIRRN
jgi:dTDP-4-amino-4,6-dideoxygalactose transaminase